MIKVANLGTQTPAICAALPNGTVCILHGEAVILGKDIVAREGTELPEPVKNSRQCTRLTGEFAGNQSLINKSAVVYLAEFTLEVTHDN